MEEKTWVLVANGRVAHVFLSIRNGPLELVESINDDNEDVPSPARKDELAVFTKRIATHLDHSFDGGQFKKLYIVASPAFLGMLREDLSPRVKGVLAEEVAKDLVHVKPDQVRSELPLVL